ncbi:MAG TPA: tetratricopeptide repeat protein [Bacteroidales bacterium]|nr:tetratricopeptide repeat protein [Bacteroidales bacterium]
MDEENDYLLSDKEYVAIFERCELMLESKIETYFDVYEFTELLDNYIDQGKLNKAYSLVNIAQKQHPGNIELEFRKARIHIERNDYDTAIDILKNLLRIEDSNEEYHTCIGVAYAYTHDYTNAIKHFDAGIALNPDTEEDNLYNIGVTFLHVDNYALAYDYLNKAHVKYPHNILVIYDLAYCCERLKQLDKSIELYKIYLDKDPYSEYAWFNMGLVYAQKEEFHDAIHAFDYAITINSKFSSAYFNRANCFMALDLYLDAREAYKELLTLEPDNELAMVCIADCSEKIGEFEESYMYYEKATEIAPDFEEGWYGLALLEFYNNNTAKAIQLFEKAIELSDSNDKFWVSYGIALSDDEQFPKAIAAFKKAISLNAYEYEAWIQYSNIEYLLNNTNVAKRIVKKGIDKAPHAALFFTLAAYYANEQDMTNALEYFTKGVSLDAEFATMYFFDMCHIPLNSLQLFYDILLK